jgi:hypothetical protein
VDNGRFFYLLLAYLFAHFAGKKGMGHWQQFTSPGFTVPPGREFSLSTPVLKLL